MALGFGVIGCGMIADFHARAIADIRGANLVGCFDLYAPSAASFADKHDCTPYTDLNKMFENC